MRTLLGLLVLALVPMSCVAQADDVGEVRRRIAQKVEQGYEQAGSPMEEMLVETGLSAEDSRRVANEFVAGLLSCVLDAAESEAEEQSLPFVEVLLAYEQALDDPEVDEPTIVDGMRVDKKAESCALREMQKAGISTELMIQHALRSAPDGSQ